VYYNMDKQIIIQRVMMGFLWQIFIWDKVNNQKLVFTNKRLIEVVYITC